MNTRGPHITVCICTFKRPGLLSDLLDALVDQVSDGEFTFSVVVTDNDAAESARPVVARMVENQKLDVVYCVEPRQNIALARNKALALATGDFIALIDDDEKPVADWLKRLLQACERYRVDGILGPVRPNFETAPPRWVVNGRFCERPEHTTGRVMPWNECRSGNFLFRRAILDGIDKPFDSQFGTGGEDMDFFRRTCGAGATFVWCNEAVAYESVPPSRLTRSYMMKRALLRGRNILKFRDSWRLIAASVLAVPLYLLMLPITVLFGQHFFMKYCIKLCDHSGRLLTVAGLNPVAEREF